MYQFAEAEIIKIDFTFVNNRMVIYEFGQGLVSGFEGKFRLDGVYVYDDGHTSNYHALVLDWLKSHYKKIYFSYPDYPSSPVDIKSCLRPEYHEIYDDPMIEFISDPYNLENLDPEGVFLVDDSVRPVPFATSGEQRYEEQFKFSKSMPAQLKNFLREQNCHLPVVSSGLLAHFITHDKRLLDKLGARYISELLPKTLPGDAPIDEVRKLLLESPSKMLLVKPARGQVAEGIRLVTVVDDLSKDDLNPNNILQTLLPGDKRLGYHPTFRAHVAIHRDKNGDVSYEILTASQILPLSKTAELKASNAADCYIASVWRSSSVSALSASDIDLLRSELDHHKNKFADLFFEQNAVDCSLKAAFDDPLFEKYVFRHVLFDDSFRLILPYKPKDLYQRIVNYFPKYSSTVFLSESLRTKLETDYERAVRLRLLIAINIVLKKTNTIQRAANKGMAHSPFIFTMFVLLIKFVEKSRQLIRRYEKRQLKSDGSHPVFTETMFGPGEINQSMRNHDKFLGLLDVYFVGCVTPFLAILGRSESNRRRAYAMWSYFATHPVLSQDDDNKYCSAFMLQRVFGFQNNQLPLKLRGVELSEHKTVVLPKPQVYLETAQPGVMSPGSTPTLLLRSTMPYEKGAVWKSILSGVMATVSLFLLIGRARQLDSFSLLDGLIGLMFFASIFNYLTQETNTRKIYEEGCRLEEEGQIDLAIECYKKIPEDQEDEYYYHAQYRCAFLLERDSGVDANNPRALTERMHALRAAKKHLKAAMKASAHIKASRGGERPLTVAVYRLKDFVEAEMQRVRHQLAPLGSTDSCSLHEMLLYTPMSG